MKLRSILSAIMLALSPAAHAAQITMVNPQQLQIPATGADFNNLILAINAILSPLTGGGQVNGGTVGVNLISLVPGAAGSPAVIQLQPGGDVSGSIQIIPDLPGGDIIFFSGTSAGGNLVFANPSMWQPVTTFATCPGTLPSQSPSFVPTGTQPLGPPSTIQGYWIFEDWLDRVHFTPSC